MRKLTITALVAAAAFAATATAPAQAYTGPCATAQTLFEKYNIQLDMHFPLLEDTSREVCRTTG
jgi:hypothetical protein